LSAGLAAATARLDAAAAEVGAALQVTKVYCL
jgi:hypothetical protein